MDWPHSPVHRLSEAGCYMVTSGTYQKAPLFRAAARLNLLCESLLRLAAETGWQLQAWSVFPNHYHFVAISPPDAATLGKLMGRLHAGTAKRINDQDGQRGRKVWFQFWDTRITSERAYLARLNYVHRNAVKHGLVREAALYPWCSAGWFQMKAAPAFYKTVMAFPSDRVSVADDFDVSPADVA
jgi:putative transposase